TTVRNVLGANSKRLTLFRAPYGEPYQDGGTAGTVPGIVARHAVHVGWALDSFDYNCPGDANCVYNNVVSRLATPGNGSYGVILMHAVHAQTADALPRIIDYLRAKGFVIWTTEQV